MVFHTTLLQRTARKIGAGKKWFRREMTKLNISSQLRRTADILRFGASNQIAEYNRRFESLHEVYEHFLAPLLVSDFHSSQAYDTACQLFGSNEVRFAAIDGTEYTRSLFDLVIFFGGAFAAKGTVAFNKHDPPKVTYVDQFIEERLGISSCIPIYVNEVIDVDQTILEFHQESETSLVKPLTDESIVNNSSISSWIMAFSELYLAYKLASNETENIQVLLLDRSLTCMQSSLMYDTSRRAHWKTRGSIHGLEVNDAPIDMNDLAYGRHRFLNTQLELPSPRGDYLRYAIVYLLEHMTHPLSLSEIYHKLKITEQDRCERALRYLSRSIKEGYITKQSDKYSLNSRYQDTWDRLQQLVVRIGDQIFEAAPNSNPMRIVKNNTHHWLTTQDIAFLTLFCLYMLVEISWKKKILLLGITKDTTSRDFKNQVIPTLVNNKIWTWYIDQQRLHQAPNTDRMFLQSMSLFNHENVHVPWSLIEYDSAFRTIIPDRSKRIGYIGGAIRNKIIPSRLFLKTYIQLSQTDYDPQLRSNVLFIDRLVYPNYDYRDDTTLHFRHDYGGADEPVEVIVFKDHSVPNDIQNLVMIMLKAMTSPSIPDAFGHNKPLFIADKVCKWYYHETRRIIDTAGKWIINNRDLRKFVFYMSMFRERRSEIEATRR
jgi:hypothetical protein